MTVQPNGFRWTKVENGLCGFLSPSRPAAPVEHPPRTPRYPLDAPAELLVEHSDAKMLVRVNELSLYGCYLDASIPLSTGTPVQIKIFGPHDYFEASATVIYAQPNVGMGWPRFLDSRCGLVPSGYYPLGRPTDFLAFSLLNY